MSDPLDFLEKLLGKINNLAATAIGSLFLICGVGSLFLTFSGNVRGDLLEIFLVSIIGLILLPPTRKLIFNISIISGRAQGNIPYKEKAKPCAGCAGKIARMVAKCPHCGARNSTHTKFVTIALLLTLFGLPTACAVAISSIEHSPVTSETDLSRYADLHCENAAKEKLLTPSSAKSSDSFESSKVMNKQAYTIRFALNSQNGFGALIKSNWFCQIEYLAGNQIDQTSWKIMDLVHD